MRAPMPLIVRGGLSRTFGSLAGFVGLGLLALGIYLLADAFAHPVNAEAAGVIVAAFSIAIAMLLLVFIFRQTRLPRMLSDKRSAPIPQQAANTPTELIVISRYNCARRDLPYHRTFVDRSRIAPRTPSPIQARGITGK